MRNIITIFTIVFCATALAELTGTGPRLQPEDRIDQEQIIHETLSLTEDRKSVV